MSRTNGVKESAALNFPLRGPVLSRCLQNEKARQRASTRPLRPKDKVSLPVASSVPLSRRDETKKSECLSRPSCRPPSPAEIKRPLTLPGKAMGSNTDIGHSERRFTGVVGLEDFILHNPASELELPRPEERLPNGTLPLAQVDALLTVPNVRDPLDVRDRSMLEVFYSTGLRRFELCGLDLAHFHAAQRTLTVRRGDHTLAIWDPSEMLRIRSPVLVAPLVASPLRIRLAKQGRVGRPRPPRIPSIGSCEQRRGHRRNPPD